jgi:hypothetical protein
MGSRTNTRHQWQIHRSGVTEGSEDTDLTASTKKWASVLSSYPEGEDGLYKISERHWKLEIRFRSNGAENDTANYKVYLFRSKGDAKFCADGTVTFGQQQATEQIDSSTTLYADAITVTTATWINPVSSTNTSGSNEQASLVFDAAGYNYALVLITSATLNGANTKKVAVDISGWS